MQIQYPSDDVVFPQALTVSHPNGRFLLFLTGPHKGMVIDSKNPDYPAGQYSENWEEAGVPLPSGTELVFDLKPTLNCSTALGAKSVLITPERSRFNYPLVKRHDTLNIVVLFGSVGMGIVLRTTSESYKVFDFYETTHTEGWEIIPDAKIVLGSGWPL